MQITICDVPEYLREELGSIGGECMKTFNGLMNVQFKNHWMTVRSKFIELRRNDGEMFLLRGNEFSKIYVQ